MRYLVILIVVLCVGCLSEKSDFKQLNDGISMKYHQLGEGDSPKIGETAEVNLMVSSKNGDTLHYVPDFPYFIPLKGSKIDTAITNLIEGDSVTLRVLRKLVNEQFKFYKLLQIDTGWVDLRLKLNKSYSSKDAKKREQKALSKREINEQAALKKYLDVNGDGLEELDGIYRSVSGDVVGDKIQYGSEVSIHYKGKFLGGYVFDDTYQKGITPTFTYGQEYQMIEGMQIGLSGLHEGESVKIILPSRRAFGEEGSLAGIVPPYSAVIFEVNIIKVNN